MFCRLRGILRATLLAATLAAFLIPQSGPARADSPGANVLVLPYISDTLWLYSIDPALFSQLPGLFAGLVKLDYKGHVAPDMAEAMPRLSADRRTYTFTLRPNLRFSDGTPLTSRDVAASISRSLSPKQQSFTAANMLGRIKGAADFSAGKVKHLTGVSAPNPRTVVITVDQPTTYFLSSLAYNPSWVVKADTPPGVSMLGPNDEHNIIASGPFMLGRPWRYRQEIYLVPNPYWYAASTIKLKEIDIRFYASYAAAFRAYQAGEVSTINLDTASVATMQGRPDFHSGLSLSVTFLEPWVASNSQCKPVDCRPFTDVHFRRALMFAINRQALITAVHATAKPACGLIPMGIDGYDPTLCAQTAYNPARARAELALARKDYGGTLPNENNLYYTYAVGTAEDTNIALTLRRQWAAVGINMKLRVVAFSALPNIPSQNTFPIMPSGWGLLYDDPQAYAENLLSSVSSANEGLYSNPTVDKLLAEGNRTPNGPARTKIYVEVQRLAVVQDAAFMPLMEPDYAALWSTKIKGLTTTGPGEWLGTPLDNNWANVSVAS